jgi:uncharacterized protein
MSRVTMNMRGSRPVFLIAASSGRALAQSAYRAGIPVHVLDLFADQDTQCLARTAVAIPGQDGGFDSERLLETAARVNVTDNIAGLIVGSGFEDRPELLESLSRGRRLLGNPPEVIRLVKDPGCFFSLLDRLGIPHPETLQHDVYPPAGWLVKRIGAAGGAHIRPLDPDGRCPEGWYLQRYMDGRSLSVVFLADGQHANIIGYNELWQARGFGQSLFKYGGAVSLPVIESRLDEQVTETVQELVAALGLVGLCGLDLVLDAEHRFYVLEINPRAPATFELHEGSRSLFWEHVQACRGQLPKILHRPHAAARAHAILYASGKLEISANTRWPVWATDRPAPGVRIGYGAPVCTVHARGSDPQTARERVMNRLTLLESGIGIWKKAA